MTVAEYLASLPADRAAQVKRVRTAIRKALPDGYEESVAGNVIAYQVPLAAYPDTYNKQPLWLAALGAPKASLTLHFMPVYANPVLLRRLEAGFRAEGKRLNIGKACIHYKNADDLALDCICGIVSGIPMARWIAIAKAARKPKG